MSASFVGITLCNRMLEYLILVSRTFVQRLYDQSMPIEYESSWFRNIPEKKINGTYIKPNKMCVCFEIQPLK